MLLGWLPPELSPEGAQVDIDIFGEHVGATVTHEPLYDPRVSGSASDDRYERGLEARKRVVGAEYVEASSTAAGELDRDFQRMVTEYCWGEVWTGTALSDKQREPPQPLPAGRAQPADGVRDALPRRAAQRRHGRRAARRRSCRSPVYAGMPAGMEAFRIARRVLAEQDDAAPDETLALRRRA